MNTNEAAATAATIRTRIAAARDRLAAEDIGPTYAPSLAADVLAAEHDVVKAARA